MVDTIAPRPSHRHVAQLKRSRVLRRRPSWSSGSAIAAPPLLALPDPRMGLGGTLIAFRECGKEGAGANHIANSRRAGRNVVLWCNSRFDRARHNP
jgi:hypothetical protein